MNNSISDDIDEEIPECPKGVDAIPHVDYNVVNYDIIERLEDNDKLFKRVQYYCRSGK